MQDDRTVQETRALILTTAEAHLRRYGYARTTVSEIARACGMSHANVYRFFKAKADIIDAVIEQWLRQTEIALQAIATQQIPAVAKLKAYVLELYRIKRQECATEQELFETFTTILQEHRTVVAQHIQAIRAILKEILRSGVQTGELQIIDLERATNAVWDATLKFHHPLLVVDTIDEPSEEQAHTILDLLIVALKMGCI
ncbi:TetR family transcriptional regulator [Gloeocapsopsis crepidinum LEGE 06123]|uniref:TetR family transcriptional regulator n=1 Tax=Gloeocapsopsis crepidinum LEGE 06123 TaxID=588587 RepID=A0ABR9USG1_9CHRO|nr:TetR/AcrR family transcriptional regulator [Gloeocapsopsis crepidinum]MBE9191211.1 TetR family transcriptional regulator [Gloeocapsopsis crepidinum LEGE 06123]